MIFRPLIWWALAAGSTHVLRSAEHHSFTAAAAGAGWTISGRMPVVIGGDSADTFIVAARTADMPAGGAEPVAEAEA